MIVTNRYAFIHMYKTGGQSISQSLLNCVAGATEIGYHTPHSLLPQEFAQLPLVALVRNPGSRMRASISPASAGQPTYLGGIGEGEIQPE